MRTSNDADLLSQPPHETRDAIVPDERSELITVQREFLIRRYARAMATMRPPSIFH